MTIDINLPAHYAPHEGLINAYSHCPLIAILRGVTLCDAADHGRAFYDAGFRIIEVPLNSPDPLNSISALHEGLPTDAIIGAGIYCTRLTSRK